MAESVFPNLHQVQQYLESIGYTCSYKRLKAAHEARRLINRRGGGWTQGSVDKYARSFLSRKVDADPAQDLPALPETAPQGAAERKVERQADILDVKATEARIDLNERLGRLTPTAVIETELGERARAFRLGLERFGHEQAEAVAELFGGSRRQARELAIRLGFPEGEEADKATALIVDFCLGRSAAFPRFFTGRINTFLDAYATGRWWTEDMSRAWEQYQEHSAEDAPEVPHVF